MTMTAEIADAAMASMAGLHVETLKYADPVALMNREIVRWIIHCRHIEFVRNDKWPTKLYVGELECNAMECVARVECTVTCDDLAGTRMKFYGMAVYEVDENNYIGFGFD